MTERNLVFPDEDQTKMIYGIANTLARQFWPDVDRDDVSQELLTKWMADWRYLQHYVYDEDEQRGQGKLRRALHNAGVTYCQAEKAARRGYSVDDVFYYSLDMLRLLLPHLGDAQAASAYAKRGGEMVGRSNKPAHESGDVLAFMMDLLSAWYRLSQPQRDILYAVWVEPSGEEEHTYGALAAELGVDTDAARKRAERALRALQRQLGGPKPVDRRRVQSNAAAQAATRADYGGE